MTKHDPEVGREGESASDVFNDFIRYLAKSSKTDKKKKNRGDKHHG